MRVIKKEPGKKPELIEIDNDLTALQEAVDGYIEVVQITQNVVIICNEEGRLRGMPYNCTFNDISFVGPVLITGVDGEDFADVPEEIATALTGKES